MMLMELFNLIITPEIHFTNISIAYYKAIKGEFLISKSGFYYIFKILMPHISNRCSSSNSTYCDYFRWQTCTFCRDL